MSVNKPSSSEEEYIAKQEALGRHKAAVEAAKKMEAEEREALKQLHYMHCPKCGTELYSQVFRGVTVDKCPHCKGTWLDEGELEQLAGREGGHEILKSIADLFRR